MINDELKSANVLIVDDEPSNLELLIAVLQRQGFCNLKGLADPRDFQQTVREFLPDIILLDLHMPHVDGFQLLADLTELLPDSELVPVIVLTADITHKARETALKLGARDFLNKPFDHTEAVLRIANHLDVRRLHRQLAIQNRELEQRVAERTQALKAKADELDQARLETLRKLAKAAEFRDDNTGKHTLRVGLNSAALAEAAGLDPDFIRRIREAAPLHDIGKIGIPDAILLKPGFLTAEEREIMKTHTRLGAKILSGSEAEVLRFAEEIALTHHERWDGNGYEGMRGEAIPISGRIVAVADVFDALTHERPYKAAWTREEAANEILSLSGTHFDPDLAQAFEKCWETLIIDGPAGTSGIGIEAEWQHG